MSMFFYPFSSRAVRTFVAHNARAKLRGLRHRLRRQNRSVQESLVYKLSAIHGRFYQLDSDILQVHCLMATLIAKKTATVGNSRFSNSS